MSKFSQEEYSFAFSISFCTGPGFGGFDDAFLVDVHPNPGDTIVHDRLLPYVALAGLRPANPRYMRWGRSLHNVYRRKLTARYR